MQQHRDLVKRLLADSWQHALWRFGQPPGYVSACQLSDGQWFYALWPFPRVGRGPAIVGFAPDGASAALAAQRHLPGARTVPGEDSSLPARQWYFRLRARRPDLFSRMLAPGVEPATLPPPPPPPRVSSIPGGWRIPRDSKVPA